MKLQCGGLCPAPWLFPRARALPKPAVLLLPVVFLLPVVLLLPVAMRYGASPSTLWTCALPTIQSWEEQPVLFLLWGMMLLVANMRNATSPSLSTFLMAPSLNFEWLVHYFKAQYIVSNWLLLGRDVWWQSCLLAISLWQLGYNFKLENFFGIVGKLA